MKVSVQARSIRLVAFAALAHFVIGCGPSSPTAAPMKAVEALTITPGQVPANSDPLAITGWKLVGDNLEVSKSV